MNSSESLPPLRWNRMDIEQRLYGGGGRFTRVNMLRSSVVGLAISVLFYLPLIAFPKLPLSRMFLERGSTPYAIVFLSAWASFALIIKWRKLALQRRCLQEEYRVVPATPGFILAASSVDVVMNNIHNTVDDPRHFVLFNRIQIALSNLRNLGRVGDVEDILRAQGGHDESSMETSYSVLNSFVWAIPVLGFIGTVLGLSQAISQFGGVLQGAADMEAIKSSLQGVTGGLATAFETTLEALVAALLIQLWLAFLKKAEEEFLDECTEYCTRNVVNKLRIMVYEGDAE
ncbi:MAG TPA: MotA/TolQ/ExbB proton channel family protein [Planctomycetaceae bacterium]|nr:MotA/TolQ/ExbB proton channel family protein [Planctomycetaceae bacterium]HQZ66411.1 MotA/TolQ/ExbB proton channel family protein [Planctomycetaceae bacterium]